MPRALALVKLAALVTVIGICVPLALTPLLGMTTGIGGMLFAILLLAWFVQGLVVFALPLMLLTRIAALRSQLGHVGTAIGLNIVIGLALQSWNAGQGRTVAFSLAGLVLFSLGGAAAGLYLFRRRAALPEVR